VNERFSHKEAITQTPKHVTIVLFRESDIFLIVNSGP